MREKLLGISIAGFAWFSALILISALFTIVGFLFIKGYGVLNLHLIFGETAPWDAILLQKPVFDGLFPAMVGTVFLVLLSVLLAVPVGLATGIYMAEYAGDTTKRIFGLLFDILAGIPSILVGLFGFSITVFLYHRFSHRIYPCLLTSALSLAFLVLPYLIRTTQVALEEISPSLRLTAPAMGATRFQNIRFVLIPHRLSGILSGVILSIGRCAEDTAVIMLTGVVASAGIPRSLLSGYEALPFYIYTVSSQYADQQELMTGYGAAVILLVICAFLFAGAYVIQRFMSKRALVVL
jgi:phosphate transport system permease protein